MRCSDKQRAITGYTLIELLCVIAIITVLATLVCGPAGRTLQRVRADQWSEQAEQLIASAKNQLHRQFGGKTDFPLVTLQRIESEGMLGDRELRFLKDKRVSFLPFAGSDPDDNYVIIAEVKRGFWTDPRLLTATKGEITYKPN